MLSMRSHMLIQFLCYLVFLHAKATDHTYDISFVIRGEVPIV